MTPMGTPLPSPGARSGASRPWCRRRRCESELDLEPEGRPGQIDVTDEIVALIIHVQVAVGRERHAAATKVQAPATEHLPGEVRASGAGITSEEEVPMPV